jgi:hypothetical protein
LRKKDLCRRKITENSQFLVQIGFSGFMGPYLALLATIYVLEKIKITKKTNINALKVHYDIVLFDKLFGPMNPNKPDKLLF